MCFIVAPRTVDRPTLSITNNQREKKISISERCENICFQNSNKPNRIKKQPEKLFTNYFNVPPFYQQLFFFIIDFQVCVVISRITQNHF